MTLKEEFEILRGEPIKVFKGDPMDIPCIETSDTERLCRHPVVSVHMITYNHEPYIRRAIEGVMMQNTDFEFELVIGEDCSKDKTREICFELQKKYPDKIRVLWWHENVSKFGGNARRVTARCRGEFIALCEGDDYWIDPFKLQKQVHVMRQFPSVTMSFTGSQIYTVVDGQMQHWECDAYCPGIINGRQFAYFNIFGKDYIRGTGAEGFVMTATVMYRAKSLLKESAQYGGSRWRLTVGDTQMSILGGLSGDIYYLNDITSVYRRTPTGAMATNGYRVCRDSDLIRCYFAMAALGYNFCDLPRGLFDRLMRRAFTMHLSIEFRNGERIKHYWRLFCFMLPHCGFREFIRFLPHCIAGFMGLRRTLIYRLVYSWQRRWGTLRKVSDRIVRDYADFTGSNHR